MSMGGDFYAISDLQLEQLLDGAVHYGDFLYDELDEKPRECYADAEYAWFELTQLLEPEMSPFSDHTDAIPEMSMYAYSDDVKRIAQRLSQLTPTMVASRYAASEMETELEELQGYIKGITDFYQRAAQNGDAVLFRVT